MKILKIGLYAVLVLGVIGVGTYLGYLYIDAQQSVPAAPLPSTGGEVHLPGDAHEIKIVAPFYLQDASPEYAQLNASANAFITKSAQATAQEKEAKAVLYATLLSFAHERERAPRERAYALNLMNLLFTAGFDADSLRSGITADVRLSGMYDAAIAHAKSLQTKKGGMSGTMFNTGTPAKNYAAQKTVAEIDRMSFELYPNSYALLRRNLNTLQADSILQGNFVTGTPYRSADVDKILAHNYGARYIDDIDAQVHTFIANGTLYRDMYASSYEIDIMYTTGVLWTKYLALKDDPRSRDQAVALLKTIVAYNDHMVDISREFDTGRLFYGYVMSAFSNSRIARTGFLTQEESGTLKALASETLRKILSTSTNRQLGGWLRLLPRSGWMYAEFKHLAGESPEIQMYFTALYGTLKK